MLSTHVDGIHGYFAHTTHGIEHMDNKLTIRTNNHWRDLIHGFELTETERAEFDYYDSDELDNASFFRYRGQVYDMGEFMRCPEPREPGTNHANSLEGWHGYASDSFFSGTCVRYADDCETVQVGRYYC